MRRLLHPSASAVILWIALPWVLARLGQLLDTRAGWSPLPLAACVVLPLLGLVGALLALWAQLERQVLGLQAILEKAGTGSFDDASGTGLHTTGPYLLTRHPFYWGFTFYTLGWMGAFGSTAGAILLVPLMFGLLIAFALLIEEPQLLNKYGRAAQKWRVTTPLIPDPRRWRASTTPPSAPPLYLFFRSLIRPLLRAWSGLHHPAAATIPGEGPLVVVANHRSYLDAFLLAAAFPRPIAFLTTAEAFRPLRQRIFLSGLGCIRLKRYCPDPVAIRKVLRTLEAGGVVGIFPEGERSWDGGSSPILPGVARLLVLADKPVVAVNLSGSYRLWPRWGWGPRRVTVSMTWSEPMHPRREREVELWLVDALATHPCAPSPRNHSAADVGRLIWRCPSCDRPNAVRGRRAGKVFCLHCSRTGQLHDGSHLSWDGSGIRPLRTWARVVALGGAERRSLVPPGPRPDRCWPFLRLSDGEGDEPLTARGKGEAVLTPKALVLRAHRWRAYLPADVIRSITVEGSHKLQVATARRIYELRYRRGSPRGPRTHLEAWLDSRDITYRRC